MVSKEAIILRGLRMEEAPRASPRSVGTRTISWGTMMSGRVERMLTDFEITSLTSIALPTVKLEPSRLRAYIPERIRVATVGLQAGLLLERFGPRVNGNRRGTLK